MNGSQLRHDLCLVQKGKSPQKNQLHFIFSTFVLHFKLTAPKKTTLKGIQGVNKGHQSPSKWSPFHPDAQRCTLSGDMECSGSLLLFLIALQQAFSVLLGVDLEKKKGGKRPSQLIFAERS